MLYLTKHVFENFGGGQLPGGPILGCGPAWMNFPSKFYSIVMIVVERQGDQQIQTGDNYGFCCWSQHLFMGSHFFLVFMGSCILHLRFLSRSLFWDSVF